MVEENNVLIKPVRAAAQELFERLEKSLEPRGIDLDALLAASQRDGIDKAAQNFGLSQAEKPTLLLALQLQAQQALETIRLQSEKASLNQLSQEEINAVIQATAMKNPVQIVLDTNVLVSGLIKREGTPGRVLDLIIFDRRSLTHYS